MKQETSKYSTSNKIAFYSTILFILSAFAFIFFGDGGNSVTVDEMLKNVHTGEVPF